MNSQTVTVNLVPGLSAPAVIRVSQYDVGRPLTIRVFDGTGAASFGASVTATIVGTKPSGLGFTESGTIAGNTVTLNTTLAMTQERGMFPVEIRFAQTGENIGTANFILAVEPSPHPDGTTDGTQETMQNLETRLQSEINDLSDRIDDIEAGGSGLSQTEKNLILTLFSKAAYAESDAESAYDALENLWTTTTRTITYNLSHVISSNTTASVESGQSYTTTLTASTNYTINSVTVTMGGVDVTSTTYSSGTVSIPSVTGNIVITATAVLAAQSITATYTQSGTVYDTDSLDSLKADLVVTANYAGGTSETVPASDYTLSGTLTVGTSTITVSYAGLTDTFSVTVSEYTIPALYDWDFTQSLTDSVENVTVTSRSGYAPTRDGNGIHLSAAKQQFSVPVSIDMSGKTLEITVSSLAFAGNSSNHIRFIMLNVEPTNTMGMGVLIWRNSGMWSAYGSTAATGAVGGWSNSAWSAGLTGSSTEVINAFNGKTVKIVFDTDGHTMTLYIDDTYEGTLTDMYFSNTNMRYISIGGVQAGEQSAGNQFFNSTITRMRIYENQ